MTYDYDDVQCDFRDFSFRSVLYALCRVCFYPYLLFRVYASFRCSIGLK